MSTGAYGRTRSERSMSNRVMGERGRPARTCDGQHRVCRGLMMTEAPGGAHGDMIATSIWTSQMSHRGGVKQSMQGIADNSRM